LFGANRQEVKEMKDLGIIIISVIITALILQFLVDWLWGDE
jgi:hypothetical protein